jgi:hypothetical protein
MALTSITKQELAPTVFELGWTDPDAPWLYKNEQYGVGIIADKFPKLPDQIVIVPAEGIHDKEFASLADLPHEVFFALAALQRFMIRKMEQYSGIEGVRAISRVDGFAVPNHPHIVMFPALRGESVAFTEPSRKEFKEDNIRRVLVQKTCVNLALTAEEKTELDQEIAEIFRKFATNAGN